MLQASNHPFKAKLADEKECVLSLKELNFFCAHFPHVTQQVVQGDMLAKGEGQLCLPELSYDQFQCILKNRKKLNKSLQEVSSFFMQRYVQGDRKELQEVFGALVTLGFDRFDEAFQGFVKALVSRVDLKKEIDRNFLEELLACEKLNFGQVPMAGIFCQAVTPGYPYLMNLCIKRQVCVDLLENEQTALMKAVVGGDVRLAGYLLDAGAQIDVCNKAGMTALACAVESGNLEMVALLLERGASLEIPDSSGRTIIMKAFDRKFHEVETALRQEAARRSIVLEEPRTVTLSDGAAKVFLLDLVRLADRAPVIAQKMRHLVPADSIDFPELTQEQFCTIIKHRDALIAGKSQIVRLFNQLHAQKNYAEYYLLLTGLFAVNFDTVEEDWHDSMKTVFPQLLKLETLEDREFLTKLLEYRHVPYDPDDMVRPFHEAVSARYTRLAELFMLQGVNLESCIDEHRETVLMKACGKGYDDLVGLLVSKGALLDAQDMLGETALLKAAWHGHEQIVECLLGKGASLELPDVHERTIFMKAYYCGHAAIQRKLQEARDKLLTIQELVKQGNQLRNVHLQDGHAQAFYHDIVLLSKYVPPIKDQIERSSMDTDFAAALILPSLTMIQFNAIMKYVGTIILGVDDLRKLFDTLYDTGEYQDYVNLYKGLDYLAFEGIEDATRDSLGRVLPQALQMRSVADKDFIKELLERAYVPKGYSFAQAFARASKKGYKDLTDVLMRRRVNVDLCDNKREQTELMKAAYEGELSVVQDLVRAGAEIDKKDWQGETALMKAATGNHSAVVTFLLSNGASCDLQDHKGKTALMKAAYNASKEAAKELIRHNAQVGIVDYDGKTAIQFASLEKDLEKELKEALMAQMAPRSQVQPHSKAWDVAKRVLICGAVLFAVYKLYTWPYEKEDESSDSQKGLSGEDARKLSVRNMTTG